MRALFHRLRSTLSWRLGGKRRLLIVANHYPPYAIGGAEIVAHRQALMLREKGWDVRVFAGHFSQAPKIETPTLSRDEVDGLTVYRLHKTYSDIGHNFRAGAVAALFARALDDFRPHVVHCHNMTDLGADLIPFAKARSARVVVTLHDYWGFCFKNTVLRDNGAECLNFEECSLCLKEVETSEGVAPTRLRRDFVMRCLEYADDFIAPSHALAEKYRRAGLSRRRLHVISNGIDLDAIPPRARAPVGEVKFLMSAYLGEHKGIAQLTQALRLLWAKPDLRGKWSMEIAGGGHLETSLREQVAKDGMDGAVRLLGRIPRADLLSRLGGADVVMLTSIWPENEPVSLLEGIASGAALIAGRIGGIVEMIEHEKNGLLYPCGEPSALAAAMERLIVDPELLQGFSRANLARRASLDEKQTGAKIDRLYQIWRPWLETVRPIVVKRSSIRRMRKILDRTPVMRGRRRIRLILSPWMSRSEAPPPRDRQGP